jgi:hypothetical protein
MYLSYLLIAEHFPYAGPYPWLNQPDAFEQIDFRVRDGRLTPGEAEQCRYWCENGYIILPKLIEDSTLDFVWKAYEKAVRDGVITFLPEPAGDGDAYPGRFLDPHQKVAEFLPHSPSCRIAALDRTIDGTGARTISNHHLSQRLPAGRSHSRKIAKNNLEPRYFHAKKGNVLIWHANLT